MQMTLSCVSSCKVTQKAHFSPFFSFPSCSFLSNILLCGSWRFVVLCCCGVCCELLSPYLTEISMVFCLYPLSREEWNRIPNFLPPKESFLSFFLRASSLKATSNQTTKIPSQFRISSTVHWCQKPKSILTRIKRSWKDTSTHLSD